MVELTIEIKLGIFVAILVIGYFVLRYFEIDPIVGTWEAVSEMEWDPKALILTLLFSVLVLAFIWKSPMWATPEEAYRITKITGVPMKTLLSILLPVIGYPLAVRALNK
ncbi:hypothetical protein LCGC14_2127180 [marine sediment metagenome]|uniref:Uncharacterized protein n=1 Tax=marine sediment metagenome TaxID=412755 RepID=A0A0F9E2I6_9ZZZZ